MHVLLLFVYCIVFYHVCVYYECICHCCLAWVMTVKCLVLAFGIILWGYNIYLPGRMWYSPNCFARNDLYLLPTKAFVHWKKPCLPHSAFLGKTTIRSFQQNKILLTRMYYCAMLGALKKKKKYTPYCSIYWYIYASSQTQYWEHPISVGFQCLPLA